MTLEEFNPKAALAQLLDGLPTPGRGISFNEKCAALCCLRGLTPRPVVMKAFGLTAATASYLANCVELPALSSVIPPSENDRPLVHPPERRGPKKRVASTRYADVASEFERLGEDEFMRIYYTDEVHTRLMEAKHLGMGKERTANRKADKYAGLHQTSWGPYFIDWRDSKRNASKSGWLFIRATEEGQPDTKFSEWRGQEMVNVNLDPSMPVAFFTSRDAHRAMLSWLERS